MLVLKLEKGIIVF